MAMLQTNWAVVLVITGASLSMSWYAGCSGRKLPWFFLGVLAALLIAVLSVELKWANVATASLAYAIMITYCPMMWLILFDKDDTSTGVANHRHRHS